MLELFKEKAEALMAEVHFLPTRTEALEFIKALIREQTKPDKAQSVLWHDESFLDAETKERLLAEFPQVSFDITPDAARSALIGINEADGAIAESGSLIEISDDIRKRLVSTLPEIHVAILYKDRILPDLKTAIKSLDLSAHPYAAFISGPSRTADIERVLTIGVHGPQRLLILCVEQ